MLAGPFSQWPEPLGLAAIGDAELVERFGDIARQEYTAVGLRVALHPQIDLATEPRWARQVATFGEDAELTGKLAAAYIRGFQGEPAGPRLRGHHDQALPRRRPAEGRRGPALRLRPRAGLPGRQLRAPPASRSRPRSTPAPARSCPTTACRSAPSTRRSASASTSRSSPACCASATGSTASSAPTGACSATPVIAGEPFPARAWGVEHLSTRERMLAVLDAGADQFGGEAIPELLVDLVRSGEISEERIDVSARRLLREKFVLGLFDNPLRRRRAGRRQSSAARSSGPRARPPSAHRSRC